VIALFKAESNSRTQHHVRGSATWEVELSSMAAEQDLMVRDGRWVSGPEDMLSIIGRSRREIYHSAILAWLLDPLARHGLGISLLQSLLAECGRNVGSDELRTVRCELEVQEDKTRADIVVSGPGFTLVVENKVDAGEQDRQCDRLFERFGGDPGTLFVFLTPTGCTPNTATEAAMDAFKPMSYPRMARLIREALERGLRTDATSHGREVVSNYLSTLAKEF
jgi:hypothetical protein